MALDNASCCRERIVDGKNTGGKLVYYASAYLICEQSSMLRLPEIVRRTRDLAPENAHMPEPCGQI